jgi:hypothetical protein
MNNDQDKREALAKIAALIKTAADAIKEAESIATIAEVDFDWSGCGYGMGGWFASGDWHASSQSC